MPPKAPLEKLPRNMYVIDFGKSRAILLDANWLYDYDGEWTAEALTKAAEGHYKDLEYNDILILSHHIPDFSNVLVEYAHWGIPASKDKKMSLSQSYETEQIKNSIDDANTHGITVRMFSHKMSWRVRKHAGFDRKNELLDAIALWKWCYDFPDGWETAKRPTKQLEPTAEIQIGWIHKELENEHFNALRAIVRYKLNADGSIYYNNQGIPTKIPWYENDELMGWQWIEKHLEHIHNELPEKFWPCFGMDVFYKTSGRAGDRTYKKGDWNRGKVKRLIPTLMYHVLVDMDGELIYKPQMNKDDEVIAFPKDGRLPGKKYMRSHIFGMKPQTDRGGVVCSNIYFWGAKKGWLYDKLCKITGQPKKDKQLPPGEERITPWDLLVEDKRTWNADRNLYTNGCLKLFSIIKRIVMEEHGLELPPEWQEKEEEELMLV